MHITVVNGGDLDHIRARGTNDFDNDLAAAVSFLAPMTIPAARSTT